MSNQDNLANCFQSSTESIMTNIDNERNQHNLKSDNVYHEDLLGPLRKALSQAEQLGNVGKEISPMTKFPPLLRPFAMMAGKAVLFLSCFILDRQRSYNNAVINIMSKILDVISDMQRQQRETITELETEISESIAVLHKDLSVLKMTQAQQERRTSMILDEAKGCLPSKFSEEQLQNLAAEREHILDPFYAAFEERFRGSREQIHDRLQQYLPFLREAGVITLEFPLLDLGCGRGEWLELLNKAGVKSRGVDLNKVFVDQCRHMGLDVCEGEALTTLRELPDNSLGGVSGFHIVEHLPLETLIALFDEALRVITPGGILVLETPNPENLLVGSCNFYFDPTHRNPIPAPTLQFIAESRGFIQSKILPLNPLNIEPFHDENDTAKRLNNLFYGPADYALIARKHSLASSPI